MRNSTEMADEVWRRIDAMEAKTSLRKSVAVIICCLVAVVGFVCLAVLNDGLTEIDHTVASAHLPLAFEEVGGYILIGVVCFALGIVVTLLCLRARKRNSNLATRNSDKKQVNCSR